MTEFPLSAVYGAGAEPGAVLCDAARAPPRLLRVPLACGHRRLAALWPAVWAAAHLHLRHGYPVARRNREPTTGRATGWVREGGEKRLRTLEIREDYIFNCHLRYTLPGLVVLTPTLEMQLVVCVLGREHTQSLIWFYRYAGNVIFKSS